MRRTRCRVIAVAAPKPRIAPWLAVACGLLCSIAMYVLAALLS